MDTGGDCGSAFGCTDSWVFGWVFGWDAGIVGRAGVLLVSGWRSVSEGADTFREVNSSCCWRHCSGWDATKAKRRVGKLAFITSA